MKVLLLTSNTIRELGKRHSGALIYCDRFLRAMSYADIIDPGDFVNAFKGNLISGKVVLVKGEGKVTVNRVVFDFGGNGPNSFRVICHYQIGSRLARLYVKWADTHEEYNDLTLENKLTVGYNP